RTASGRGTRKARLGASSRSSATAKTWGSGSRSRTSVQPGGAPTASVPETSLSGPRLGDKLAESGGALGVGAAAVGALGTGAAAVGAGALALRTGGAAVGARS